MALPAPALAGPLADALAAAMDGTVTDDAGKVTVKARGVGEGRTIKRRGKDGQPEGKAGQGGTGQGTCVTRAL